MDSGRLPASRVVPGAQGFLMKGCTGLVAAPPLRQARQRRSAARPQYYRLFWCCTRPNAAPCDQPHLTCPRPSA
eukprot:scaffold120975_cov66-Phaeocystis_antarctica.AAC.5